MEQWEKSNAMESIEMQISIMLNYGEIELSEIENDFDYAFEKATDYIAINTNLDCGCDDIREMIESGLREYL